MKSSGVTPHETPLQTVFLHFTPNGRWSDMPESPLTHFQEKKLMQLHWGNTKEASRLQYQTQKYQVGKKFTVHFRTFSTEKIHEGKTDTRNICFAVIKSLSVCINWCCQFRQLDGVFMYPLPSSNNMATCADKDISCSFKFVFSRPSYNNRLYPFCSPPITFC